MTNNLTQTIEGGRVLKRPVRLSLGTQSFSVVGVEGFIIDLVEICISYFILL